MTSPPAPAARPEAGLRERKKAKTRAAIQEQALRLFRQQGYAATTVDQIAEAAEISQSTFFRYFANKEAVVLLDEFDPVLIEAFLAQPPELTPVQALRACIQDVFGNLSEEQWAREQQRHDLIRDIPELRSAVLQQFTDSMELLTAAIAQRVGRSADDLAVRAFSGAVIGVGLAAVLAASSHVAPEFLRLFDEGLQHLEKGFPL